MQTRRLVTRSILALLLTAGVAAAQDKTPAQNIPLRVTVVFNEYEGGKKIASLPYIMPCEATTRGYDHWSDSSQLKMGFRVPVRVNQQEIQFQDVGTHIDCSATRPDERGGFMVRLGVAHSAVYSPWHSPDKAVEWRPGEPLAADPVFGGIEANLVALLIHNGQTVEALTATYPVSGRLWKVEVTLNVVK